MANVIEYNGADKWKQKATELLNQGGGGGGTDDYNDLDNKPSINSVTLEGDMELTDIFGDRFYFSNESMSIFTGDPEDATALNPVYEIGFDTSSGSAEFYIEKHDSPSTGEIRYLDFSRVEQLLRWTDYNLHGSYQLYPVTYSSTGTPQHGTGMCLEAPVSDDPADGIYRAIYTTDSIQLSRVIGGSSQGLMSVKLSELAALNNITGNIQTRLADMQTEINDKVGIGSQFEGNRIPMTTNLGNIIELPYVMLINGTDLGLDFIYYYTEEE